MLDSEGDDERCYRLSAPGYRKTSATREHLYFDLVPPHEALAEEVAYNGTILSKLQADIAEGSMPPRYTEHPVVRSAGDTPVVPIAMYFDFMPYCSHDSALGIYVYNTITNIRHLIISLRKEICAGAAVNVGAPCGIYLHFSAGALAPQLLVATPPSGMTALRFVLVTNLEM